MVVQRRSLGVEKSV